MFAIVLLCWRWLLLSDPCWWTVPPSSFGTVNWIWPPDKTDVLQKLMLLGKTETWMDHKENKSEWKYGTLEAIHTLSFWWLKWVTKEDLSCTSLNLILITLQIKEAEDKSSHYLWQWMGVIILSLVISLDRTEYWENLILSEELCTPWEVKKIYKCHDFKQEHQAGDKITGEFTILLIRQSQKELIFKTCILSCLRKSDFKHSTLLGRL